MTKLHHIGIVIHSRDQIDVWLTIWGGSILREYYVAEYQAQCIFCGTEDGPALELILPEGGILAEFNRGAGGLHHIALEVESIDAMRDEVRDNYSLEFLEKQNVDAGPILINFLPPVLTRGVTIEYVQRNSN